MSEWLILALVFVGAFWVSTSISVIGWKMDDTCDFPTALAWGILWPVLLLILVLRRACGLLRDAILGRL